MKRTYKVHFTVKGVTTIELDDCDYDTTDYGSVAEREWEFVSEKQLMQDLNFDTVEIAFTKEVDE